VDGERARDLRVMARAGITLVLELAELHGWLGLTEATGSLAHPNDQADDEGERQ
jgi:hypothetical protein